MTRLLSISEQLPQAISTWHFLQTPWFMLQARLVTKHKQMQSQGYRTMEVCKAVEPWDHGDHRHITRCCQQQENCTVQWSSREYLDIQANKRMRKTVLCSDPHENIWTFKQTRGWGKLYCAVILTRISGHSNCTVQWFSPEYLDIQANKRMRETALCKYSNIYPTRCNVTQFILSGNCSTCFGWYHHPSSGAQTTVSTASCQTVIATCRCSGR